MAITLGVPSRVLAGRQKLEEELGGPVLRDIRAGFGLAGLSRPSVHRNVVCTSECLELALLIAST